MAGEATAPVGGRKFCASIGRLSSLMRQKSRDSALRAFAVQSVCPFVFSVLLCASVVNRKLEGGNADRAGHRDTRAGAGDAARVMALGITRREPDVHLSCVQGAALLVAVTVGIGRA